MAQRRDIRATIVQLLSNVSDGKEIRAYLQRFSEIERTRFAVIKIGGAILRDRLEETAASLALLHTVGLTPIVIHGGGPQLDERLQHDGIVSGKVDGLRVTTPQILDVARDVFTEQNILLVEAVRAQGVDAHGLTQGVFDAEFVDRERYGLVGEPTSVHLDLLRSIVKSGAIPILTCLGVAPGGQMVNINADSATRLLVHEVQPMKIIFLSDTGGLLDGRGDVIDSINLATDYEELMGEDWVHSGMRLKLAEIKRLLDDAPLTTSVSITTPSALARELFTHGGAGTLVRMGEIINRLDSKEEVDGSRLSTLIGNAFERRLTTGWFEELELLTAYVSESYRAAAVVSELDEFTYLD
ncbi:MAG: acetylglutamate kinase, partial [Acidimicrobiia bacterium]